MNENELARIRPFDHDDALTGHKVVVRLTSDYSVLSINGREYYFIKESGEFDGTSFPVTEYKGV